MADSGKTPLCCSLGRNGGEVRQILLAHCVVSLLPPVSFMSPCFLSLLPYSQPVPVKYNDPAVSSIWPLKL